eukprot:gb/GFBE01008584.1/.p1 GENE.gb/GFBE01008584.1/~~gb/GFBE01008584.1/.p1  ORF type:complete len:412 (+),score=78.02 gb/GFBE01008584.1/:1-1236(+)
MAQTSDRVFEFEGTDVLPGAVHREVAGFGVQSHQVTRDPAEYANRGDHLQVIECKIRCNIDKLHGIDQESQLFGAHVFVELRFEKQAPLWAQFKAYNAILDDTEDKDKDVSMFDEDDMEDMKFIQKVGLQMTLYNEVAELTETTPKQFVTKGRDLMVIWAFRAVFGEEFEYYDFPVDLQEFAVRIRFGVPLRTAKGRRLKVLPHSDHDDKLTSRFAKSAFTMNNMWTMGSVVVVSSMETTPQENYLEDVFQVVKVHVYALRHARFYIVNIMVPMFVFVLFAATSFCVPREEVADRLSVSLMLVLVSVAFRFTVPTPLPPIGYFSLLDWHTANCNAFITLIVAENAVAGKLFGPDARSDKSEGMLCGIILGVFVLLDGMLSAVIFCRWRANHHKFNAENDILHLQKGSDKLD